MEKLYFSVVSAVLFLFTFTYAYSASLDLNYDGKIVQYKGPMLTLAINGGNISAPMPPVVIDNRTLVPAREVFEKLGAKVTWYARSKKVVISMKSTVIILWVNKKMASVVNQSVQMDVPAKIINNKVMIPLRFVGEQLGFKVGWKPEKGMVTVDDIANISAVTVQNDAGGGQSLISVNSDREIRKFTVVEMNDPARLVIDIQGADNKLEQKNITVQQNNIDAVRTSQFQEDPSITRVVIDFTQWPGYKVETSQDGKSILVKLNSNPSKLVGVKYVKQGQEDGVEISLDNMRGHVVKRLANPDSIVLEVPNTLSSTDVITKNIGSELINDVKYSTVENNTLRVILELKNQAQFRVLTYDGRITLLVSKAPWNNVEYYSDDQKCEFYIKNMDLSSIIKKKFDITDKTLTLSIPSDATDLGQGDIYVNDNYIYDIDIIKNTDNATTDIVFHTRNYYASNISFDQQKNNTVVVLAKPAPGDGRLVVIDAGHGGDDPGAKVGDNQEKDFNLNIALKLEKLLNDMGVSTYMTRREDVFVDLYDRAGIANNMGAALFLSIHNNATDNPDYDGTMTLYFPDTSGPNGFSSQRFAQIIQSRLLETLKTTDRSIIPRPNLVVLRETTMPAALAEVAFLTNAGNLGRLQDDSFRQKAAEALYGAILQALDELKGTSGQTAAIQ